jgi:hypothetical protein
MTSTLPVVPPPGTIDLASEDMVVDVDLEKTDDDLEQVESEDATGVEEEDGSSFPEVAPVHDTKSKKNGKKVCLWASVGFVVVLVVIIGAVVGTKDQRAAKSSSASSNGPSELYACATKSLICPTLPETDRANITITAITVGETVRGESTRELFGRALSVNCDGTIIAVGSSEYDDRSGQVKVWKWVDSGESRPDATLTPEERAKSVGWVQLGQTLVPAAGSPDRFGHSVSLSQDGNRLAVGGRFTDTVLANGTMVENVGSVVVFQLDNGIWQPIGQVLLGESENDQSGRSVDLDWDGSRLIIGEFYLTRIQLLSRSQFSLF